MGILPSTTPLGRAQLTVIHGGEASEPQEVDVLSRAVGIFTESMDGRGPGVVQNVVSNADQPLNQLTRPALPGQCIVLWATGLGGARGEYASQWFVSLIRPDSEAAVFSAPGIDYGALLLSFGQFRAVGIE